jgi:uracil-DNA glycosylase family 4
MNTLLTKIKGCQLCLPYLKDGVNPVVAANPKSKIVIIGQAPGKIVHQSGVPWNDKSGDNLRAWLGIDSTTFYDAEKIALMPMGFCYPGKGKTGDLPPRQVCAPLWHTSLLDLMKEIRLVLLVGQYAQQYYLKDTIQKTLTSTVQNFELYLPKYFPLPHPSPRNNIWQAKNEWFAKEVLPVLKKYVKNSLKTV